MRGASDSPRARVLVVHAVLEGRGGSDQVAAWTIQAIASEYDVTVVTLRPVDFPALDRFAQTNLTGEVSCGRIRNAVSAPWIDRILEALPLRASLLRTAFAVREAKRLDRLCPFDYWVSTFNEIDMGRPGIQYVHYPWTFSPRPESELKWYSRSGLLLRLYQRLCCAVGGMSRDAMAANLSLANSAFVAAKVDDALGGRVEIVPPPVPGNFAPLPWDERVDEVVCVGRIAAEKNVLDVIRIVDDVRGRGFDLGLRVVGLVDEEDYLRLVRQAVQERPWLDLEIDVTRERLFEILHRARWGVHAMVGEHFGISVAEMVRAGCIVFAHNSGGPVEILGGDRRLLFDDCEDAVEKLCVALSSNALRLDLSRHTAERAATHGTDTFCRRIVESVRTVAP